MTTLILLAVVAVLAYRMSTPEMRSDALRAVLTYGATLRDYGRKQLQPFHAALRARTPMLVVTPAIVLLMVACSLFLPAGARFSDGPRTTNGEWWRLLTAMCAQPGLLTLAIDIVVVVQLGNMLERLIGRWVFLTAFAAGGVLPQLALIWTRPLAVWQGASSAVAALYGLLIVAFVAGRLHRSEVTVPLMALKRAAPLAALFAVAAVGFSGSVAADAIGFAIGIVAAIATSRDVSESVPDLRRARIAAGVAAATALAMAVPLRGILDVKPELARLVALERQTRQMYDSAYVQYQQRKKDAESVARTIEASIVPTLHAADERIAGLRHVPPEDEPRLADAKRYLELRTESWKLLAQSLREQTRTPLAVSRGGEPTADSAFRARAQAWHRSTSLIRGKAEAAERGALEALNRISTASSE